MKKGRHRRFEEARAQKRQTNELSAEPCPECGAAPEAEHASWCLATEDDGVDEVDEELDAGATQGDSASDVGVNVGKSPKMARLCRQPTGGTF